MAPPTQDFKNHKDHKLTMFTKTTKKRTIIIAVLCGPRDLRGLRDLLRSERHGPVRVRNAIPVSNLNYETDISPHNKAHACA